MHRSPFRVLRPEEVSIVRLQPDDWEVLRELRLALLADAPMAFGSTLAREQDFTQAAWRSRADSSANFVALAGELPVGIAAGHHADEDGDEVQLMSMWVHPDWRRLRLGARLTTTVVEWARGSGFRAVRLWVAVDNEAAEKGYAQLGFARTGASMPIRPDEPWRLAREMRRQL